MRFHLNHEIIVLFNRVIMDRQNAAHYVYYNNNKIRKRNEKIDLTC
jgi:hypothetical protein